MWLKEATQEEIQKRHFAAADGLSEGLSKYDEGSVSGVFLFLFSLEGEHTVVWVIRKISVSVTMDKK